MRIGKIIKNTLKVNAALNSTYINTAKGTRAKHCT